MAIKSLILIDESSGSQELIDQYLYLLDNKTNKHITCAFVEGITHKKLTDIFDSASLLNNQYSYKDIFTRIMQAPEPEANKEFAEQFIERCEKNGIKAKVFLEESEDTDFVSDTRFYDLLLLHKALLNPHADQLRHKETLESILRESECPVLLLNESGEPFKNIILLFDGTERSINAIKMFAYILGDQLKKHRVILNTVINDNTIIHEKHICDYIKMYQPFFSINRIYPENYFADLYKLLNDTNEFLLVSGISRNDLIEDLIFNQSHSFFLEGNRSIFMY